MLASSCTGHWRESRRPGTFDMANEDRLADLLLQWEELFDQGQDTPPAELCRDCPELTDALAEQIRELKAMEWIKREPPVTSVSAQNPGERPPAPRTLAGRYRLDTLLGEGGFGQVWQAYDTELERPVAVKVPKARHVDAADNFLAEARKIARLRHAGIIPIHDVGRDRRSYFIVTDMIEGGSLADRLRATRPDQQEAARIVAEVADALSYSHQQGVIHRDVKPANILVDRQGHALLADFGIAVTDQDRQQASSAGTLAYTAPEQVGGLSEVRSDIYSLGVVLYELLTGRLPIQAASLTDLREQILTQDPPLPRSIDGSIPAVLERICLKCLAKRPTARYATAGELADDLKTFLRSRARKAPWRRRLGMVFVVAVGLAAVAWLLTLAPKDALAPTSNAVVRQPTQPVVETRPAASSLAIHKGFINTLAFSGDGKKLATAGQDSVLRVHDTADCRLLTSLSGHQGFVECLAWSPGKVLASGGADKLVRLWDTDAGSLKHTLPVDDRVSALSWAADGKALLIATTDGKLRAWDAASNRTRFIVDADPYGCWSPDGRFVATYRWGQPAVRIWDAETGKLARAFPVHMKVGTLAWSPDGAKLAVNGCDDNCFWVLDALKGTVLRKSQRASAGIFIRVAWSPDGQLLATAHEHSFVMLWNPTTGEPVRNLGRHDINSSIPSLVWSPDGETVASASTDRSVRIWSILGEMPALKTLRGTPNE